MTKRLSWVSVLLLWAARGAAGMASEGTVVLDTPSGRIQGERYVLADGSRGMRFLGIPYARPPLGPLRFAAPEEAGPWEGVLDASQFGAMCYQPLENDVWDTVHSDVDLGHLEDQLRRALAMELGQDLYEEQVEELEDEARKTVEKAHTLEEVRKEEGCEGNGVDGTRPQCREGNLDDTVPVSRDEEVFRTSGPTAASHTASDNSSGSSKASLTASDDSSLSSNSSRISFQRSSDETRSKNNDTLLQRRLWKINTGATESELSQAPGPPLGGGTEAGHAPRSLQPSETRSESVKHKGLLDRTDPFVRQKEMSRKGSSSSEGEATRRTTEEDKSGKNSKRDGGPAQPEGYLFLKQKHIREYLMSEDCLTLNVYAPLLEGRRRAGVGGPTNATLPILFYIHGGSFYSNGGRLYPGEKLASEGMVVVTINYRLGPFGFLSTGDSSCRGNWGLLDQRLALLWVRRHARAFGGRRDKLVLVGNSAGAASVILHLVSPLSRGLFTRAVALSGCALAPWSLQTRPQHFAKKLAADVGCPDTSTWDLVTCLRLADADTINQVYGDKNLQDGLWLAFAPVVEGDLPGVFLPRSPRSLLEEGSLPAVPLIMTLTRDEVSIWFRNRHDDISLVDAEKWMDMLMRQKFPELEPLALAAVMHAVRASYLYRNGYHQTPAAPHPMVPIKIMSELISDLGLRVPCVEEAGLLSRWTTLHFAEFSYASPDDVRVGDQKWIGSYHESELQFVFGQPYLGLANTLRGPMDRAVASTIMGIMVSFAHTGVPEVREVEWPAYNVTHLVHLEMNDRLSISHNLVQHRLCFWQRFIPLLTLWPMKPPNDYSGSTPLRPPLAASTLALLLLLLLLLLQDTLT